MMNINTTTSVAVVMVVTDETEHPVPKDLRVRRDYRVSRVPKEMMGRADRVVRVVRTVVEVQQVPLALQVPSETMALQVPLVPPDHKVK